MKYLKWLGYTIVALLVLFIILGIVMPKDFLVEKSRKFDYPPEVAYNILNDLSLHEQWNPWIMEDTTMELTYSDIVVGKGASYAYTSEEHGEGIEKITNSLPSSLIEVDIAFGEDDPAKIRFDIQKEGKGSNVRWSMTGRQGFPMNVFLPFMKFGIGRSFKAGLKNLDKIAEKRWEEGIYYGYTIKAERLPKRDFVSRRAVISNTELQLFYATNLPELLKSIFSDGAEMDGMPCGLYYDYDNGGGTIDVAAAIPVSESLDIDNTVAVTMNKGPGLVIDHYGDYNKLSQAHQAMECYMRDRGLVNHAPIIEEYISDPGEEKNPEKVLTKVFYYLAETGRK